MARVWDSIDAEMEQLGHFEQVSRGQVMRKPQGKRAMKTKRKTQEGDRIITNKVVGRISHG